MRFLVTNTSTVPAKDVNEIRLSVQMLGEQNNIQILDNMSDRVCGEARVAGHSTAMAVESSGLIALILD